MTNEHARDRGIADFDYTGAWKEHGELYKKLLDEVEDSARQAISTHETLPGDYARMLHPVIAREHSDVPEVTIEWQQPDDITRSVQIRVVTTSDMVHTLKFTVSAYVDDFDAGTRYWYSTEFSDATDDITSTIYDAISFAQLQITKHSLLEHSSNLPPFPSGLSAEAKRQITQSARYRH
jgi:hypothetical protein